ncbi:hypothetical protein [Hoyosella altamirensis]|uniref:hypothetical protein n=1 Tax=Hoyosella altamirensis TaxID=616997 RepID=UPI0007DAECF3|nr:hypothetical protein [Hoyosella altamirensis]
MSDYSPGGIVDSSRDDLIEDLRRVDEAIHGEPVTERDARIRWSFHADHLIREGWRKPRTITTVEELDTLPTGSIVRGANTDILERLTIGWDNLSTTGGNGSGLDDTPKLPAVVLGGPEAKQ